MDKVTIAYSSRSRFMGGDYLNHHQAWIDIDPLGTKHLILIKELMHYVYFRKHNNHSIPVCQGSTIVQVGGAPTKKEDLYYIYYLGLVNIIYISRIWNSKTV